MDERIRFDKNVTEGPTDKPILVVEWYEIPVNCKWMDNSYVSLNRKRQGRKYWPNLEVELKNGFFLYTVAMQI